MRIAWSNVFHFCALVSWNFSLFQRIPRDFAGNLFSRCNRKVIAPFLLFFFFFLKTLLTTRNENSLVSSTSFESTFDITNSQNLIGEK